MKKVKSIEVTPATPTKELVEFWNKHAAKIGRKKVVKFSSRGVAETRIDVLQDELGALGALATEEEGGEGNGAGESGKRSAGIALSWQDPAVRAARSERSSVTVDGVPYKSCPAAFRALGIDLKGCIQFRGILKANGKETDSEGRKWVNVPKVKK